MRPLSVLQQFSNLTVSRRMMFACRAYPAAQQFGHSSIKTTVDVYGHSIPGANHQVVNKFVSLVFS